MLSVFLIAMFAAGALISCLNFYVSFLRFPISKVYGLECKNISCIPVVGSLLLIVSAAFLSDSPILFWGGLIIALLDTGGLHWFAGILSWRYLQGRNQS